MLQIKTSLSARVALGLIAQMTILAGAVFYLVWASNAIFDDLSALKDDLDPATDDMRAQLTELKGSEEVLTGFRARDADRLRTRLPRRDLFDRLTSDAAGLRRVAGREGTGPETGLRLNEAAALMDEAVEQRAIIESLRPRLEPGGVAGGTDAETAAREMLRSVRTVRTRLLQAMNKTVTASRDATHDIFERRTDMLGMILVVLAIALLAALVVMVFSLKALKPVGDLVSAVHRLAHGDYSVVPSRRLSRELADIAEALSSLAAALKARDADIERKKDALMQAERLATVGRMASVVAHEVRNPLNSIMLNTDLLRDALEANGRMDARSLQVVTAVQREIDRLSEITETYLQFGRLPKGELVPCDAVRVINETVAFMDGEFTAAGVSVSCRFSQPSILIVADEGQLRQALVNILRNAIQAMPHGGDISIEGGVSGKAFSLSIHDSGVGIPEAFKTRLFEPFATTKERGTGLGLAYVKQVTHDSGGDVFIDSSEGKGTTVRFVLQAAIKTESGGGHE